MISKIGFHALIVMFAAICASILQLGNINLISLVFGYYLGAALSLGQLVVHYLKTRHIA